MTETTYRQEFFERANRVIPAVTAVGSRGRFLKLLGVGLFVTWALLEGLLALVLGQLDAFNKVLSDVIGANS